MITKKFIATKSFLLNCIISIQLNSASKHCLNTDKKSIIIIFLGSFLVSYHLIMFSDVELYGKREGLRQYACLRPCKPYVKNVMQMRTLFLNQSSVKNFISHLIHTFRWSNPLIWYAAVVGWPNSHPNWYGVGILSSTPTHSAMHINLKKEKRNDFTEKRKHPTRLCHPSPT